MRRLAVLFLGLTALASRVEAEGRLTRFEWDHVQGTHYYLGTIATKEGPTYFRAYSHWVLLPDTPSLTIQSVDHQGRRRPVTVRSRIIPDPMLDAPPIEETPAVSTSPEELFADYELGAAAYGDAPSTSGLDLDQGTAAAPTEDNDFFEPTFKKPEPPPPEQTGEPSVPKGADPLKRSVAFDLGIGKETLNAKGGASEFNGNANIGGIDLFFETRLGASNWFTVTRMNAHNFATTTVSENVDSGVVTEDIARYLRTSVATLAYFDFSSRDTPIDDSSTVGVGFGLSYVRMPMLHLIDDNLGTTELQLRSGVGPTLGLYGARYLAFGHTVGAMLSYVPMSLSGPTKTLASSALLFWRHLFMPAFFTDLSLLYQTETLKAHEPCSAAAHCTEDSRATSRITALKLGIGVQF